LMKLADYEHLKNELRGFGLLLEFDTSEETKPFAIMSLTKVYSFRLIKFFSVNTLKPKRSSSGLIADKNAVCHGSFSDEEFQQVKDVAKRNDSFLQSYGITITYVENMVILNCKEVDFMETTNLSSE